MSRPALLLLVLFAVAATMHGALRGELVYDDLRVIAGNPAIDHPHSWWATLATPLWGADYPHWRPLTQLLLAVSFTLGGAAGVHALALALHLCAVWLVWRLASRLCGEPRVAALVALCFGVHTVQAESVAWAAALNDPLWGLCALAAIDAHLRAPATRLAWPAWLFAALALAAKETGAVVPVLLAAVDLWRQRVRGEPVTWRRLRPLAVVYVVWFVLRALVFGDLRAGFDRGPQLELATARAATLPFELLSGNAMLLVWPWPASMFRMLPAALDGRALALAGAGAALLLLAAWLLWLRAGLSALGVLLVVASLLPQALRPASLGEYPLADRYLYFAVFAAALALAPWLRSRRVQGVVLALCAAHAVGAALRTRDFADQASFVASHPAGDDARLTYMAAQLDLTAQPSRVDVARAKFARAAALAASPRLGDPLAATRLRADIDAGLAWCEFLAAAAQPRPDFRAAAQRFARLLEAHEAHAPAHAGYGVCLAELGDLAGAERHLRRALELEPSLASAQANLQRVLALRARR